jgi:hypothetical protein
VSNRQALGIHGGQLTLREAGSFVDGHESGRPNQYWQVSVTVVYKPTLFISANYCCDNVALCCRSRPSSTCTNRLAHLVIGNGGARNVGMRACMIACSIAARSGLSCFGRVCPNETRHHEGLASSGHGVSAPRNAMGVSDGQFIVL